MQQAGVTEADCPAVQAALRRADETAAPAGAMQLPDGRIVTGKTSALLGAAASMLLNALKALAGIDQETDVISPSALEPICVVKTRYLRHQNPRLHSDETLIALSISSARNADAAKALEQLDRLRGCDAHFSVILSSVDEKIYKRLGINVTCEPQFESKLRQGELL